jgi:hypothetical protein
VRSPELSATFLQNLTDREHVADGEDDLSAIEEYRVLLKTKEWRSYWTGRSKLNLLKFAQEILIEDLISFGSHLEYQFTRMRVTKVLRQIKEWPHMGRICRTT